MIRNITEVRLLNVPLESDYKHTLYFSSLSEQVNWFKNKTMLTGEDFTYIRKDGYIRYGADYDELTHAGINYIMYRNTSYSDKWYFAFVTKIEFVNDGVSFIHFETDVIQTWLFDYVVQPSFVEREHVSVDNIGENTIPEGLELGEYVGDETFVNGDLLEDTLILASTVNLNSDSLGNVSGAKYGGVYSGVRYYEVTPADITNILKELAGDGTTDSNGGKVDSVTSIFVAPKNFVESNGSPYKVLTEKDGSTSKEWLGTNGNPEITKPTKLNGYTPKNKKLLTFPYCYLLMDNNAGGSATYHYELFSNEDYCPFVIHATPTPGYSVRIIPKGYKGTALNNIEGLNLGKYPVCSWTSDVYTNWLTQNSVNIRNSYIAGGIGVAGGVISGALGLATGSIGGAMGGASGITSGLMQIAGTMGQVHQHSLLPGQAEGNLNNGDVTFASKNLTFTAYQMSIKYEYAQIIDKYFDMYGYKVNRVHTPNKNHRESFWFTKTIDVNIDGNVPMDDMLKIKQCYDRGITFWKDKNNIGNYSVDNETVQEVEQ